MITSMAIAPMMRREHAKKKGFTLTEIAIVLGIIGLILGAIWAAASSVYANLKANQAQQGILAAAQGVRSLFATSAQSGVATGTNAAITSPGMFPTNWQSAVANGVVGNPWHINPAAGQNWAYVIGNGSTFAVEIDGISDAGCAQLIGFYTNAASGANGGQVPGLVGSAVATKAPTGGTMAIGKTSGTAPPVAANFAGSPSVCKGGGLNDSVAITFDMSIM